MLSVQLYLLADFLSGFTNCRMDEYGGSLRFAVPALAVRDPHLAVAIDEEAVREDEPAPVEAV